MRAWRAILAFAGIVGLGVGLAFAQDPAPKAEFEVASIHESQSSGPGRVKAGLRLDGSQAYFSSLSVKNLMTMAYKVQSNQITGPDWISQERFDISAKLPEGSTTEQIPAMLQALLADRFALKTHLEKKEMPAYALVLAKSPLKLTEAPPDTNAPQQAPGTANVSASGSAAGVSIDLGNGSSATLANDQFDFKKTSMDQAAMQLARYMDRPVVNMTDLKGSYNFTLPVSQEDYEILLVQSGVNAGVQLPPMALRLLDQGPPTSLFDALEKVGLHLDARKVPLDLIVVDSGSSTPTEN